MERSNSPSKTVWRILLSAQAAVLALVILLRALHVFSFRLTFVAALLLAFLALDGVLLAAGYDRRHRTEKAYRTKRGVLLCILALACLSSLPLFTGYLLNGHDIQFHLFRIEGIRDGLAGGQFPVRIHPNTLYGYGYANPEFYPELLLYFPALLRLCGFSVVGAYKTFVFALNLLTAAISYLACARICKSVKAGLAGSAFYTLSLYRLVNLYTRAAIGEASAMTFLPLVTLGLFSILFDDVESPAYKRAFLPLLAGMTGLLSTHLLSCEMILPLLIVCCLVFWRRTFTGRRLLSITAAAVGTVLLALCFLVPMLDYMGYDAYRVFSYSTSNLSNEAVGIAQLFPLLPNAVGESNAASLGAAGEMPLGVGFPCLFILALYPLLSARQGVPADAKERDLRRAAVFCYAAALLLLIMSTNVFPWNALYRTGGFVAQVAGLIQFPWRLHSLSTLLLMLVVCRCAMLLPSCPNAPLRRAAVFALAMLLCITSVSYCDRLVQEGEALAIHSNADLDQTRSVGDAEYLPAGASGMADYLANEPLPEDGLAVTGLIRNGTTVTFTAENGAADTRFVDLPLIRYLGYRAEDGTGNPLPIEKGESARIRVIVPAGYHGAVTVRFAERPLWRAAEAFSLASLVLLAFWYYRQRRRFGAESVVDYTAPVLTLE